MKKLSAAKRKKFVRSPYGKKVGKMTQKPTPFDKPGSPRGSTAPPPLIPGLGKSSKSGAPPFVFGLETPDREIIHGYLGPM